MNGQGSNPVEGEASRVAPLGWVDGSFWRFVAVESGVRAGGAPFLVRGLARGLTRGEAAGGRLDGPAGISSGGVSSGRVAVTGVGSSSTSMTSRLGEEAEVALGRGVVGGGDTSSDMLDWTEGAEATDPSVSLEVADGEEPREGGGACVRPCLRGVEALRDMVWSGGWCLWVGRVV